jgi:GH15 family glucan-1,4-alpha-glucosidase
MNKETDQFNCPGKMELNYTHRPQNNAETPIKSFPPIEDYGIIGNCHTVALISSRGSIDWLCLPRFDSPSLFAAILDIERGGSWSIQPTAPMKSSHRYLDETNVLATTFTCAEGRILLLDFMDIANDEQVRHLAAPGRLVRIVECQEGTVEIVSTCTPRPDYARSVPEFTASGTEVSFGLFTITGPTEWQVNTTTHRLTCQITLHAGERIAFTLATIVL